MRNNERGSSLLIVMLMIMVFTVLGLSILSTSIGGAKRTAVREEQVTGDLDTIRYLGEAVAFIKATIDKEYHDSISVEEYTQLVNNKLLVTNEHFQIQNKTGDFITADYTEDSFGFTRVLEVTSGKFSQLVYITGIPSFLKYAVGSRGILTLNGSTFVEEGNIYAKDLVIANQAKYIYNTKQFNNPNRVIATSFPSVSSPTKNLLYIENENIKICSSSDCYDTINHQQKVGTFPTYKINEILNGAIKPFNPVMPQYTKEDTEFIEVDIEKTFKEKLQAAGFLESYVNPHSKTVSEIIEDKLTTTDPWPIKLINSFETVNYDTTTNGYKSYLFKSDQDIYFDTDSLILDKDKWIVIDGNAIIENDEKETMSVSANILVHGNLTIRGNIEFNSTIYVYNEREEEMGITTINNVNIKGYKDGELILMSQGPLEIARINKEANNIDKLEEEQENSIKAYLYTNTNAEVYAIGSYLDIEGGIFAKGNLEINAFRGRVKYAPEDIIFDSKSDKEESRLIVRNNKKLFHNHAQGLPKVKKLEVITDLMKKD